MSRISRFLAILAALLFGSMAANAGSFSKTNLISNGGFEQGVSGGNPTGATWGIWGSAKGYPTYAVAGRTAGKRAARTTISAYPGPDGDAKWLHAPVVVREGETFQFTGYYKSSVPAEADLEVKVGAGYQYFLKRKLAKATSWTYFSFFFTVPTGATEARVIVPIKQVGWLDIDDFAMYKEIPVTNMNNGLLTIAFDDGWTEHQKLVAGILEKAGIRGTFYVCAGAGFLDAQGQSDGYMTADQIVDLSRRGHVVGSHSLTHPMLTSLSPEQAHSEIFDSKAILEGIIGQPVTTIAYPYGDRNPAIDAIVQSAGYTSGRSIEDAFVRVGEPYSITSWSPVVGTPLSTITNKIKEAKAKHQWIIISLHRIVPSNGGDEYYNTQKWLQDLVNFAKTSGVPHVTIPEGLAIHG